MNAGRAAQIYKIFFHIEKAIVIIFWKVDRTIGKYYPILPSSSSVAVMLWSGRTIMLKNNHEKIRIWQLYILPNMLINTLCIKMQFVQQHNLQTVSILIVSPLSFLYFLRGSYGMIMLYVLMYSEICFLCHTFWFQTREFYARNSNRFSTSFYII